LKGTLRAARRKDTEDNHLPLTGSFEGAHELRAAIDLNRLDRKGQARRSVRKAVAVPAVAWLRTPTAASRETTSTAGNWRRSNPGSG
jgi:hypothetical protein